jgi:hypothetical protein
VHRRAANPLSHSIHAFTSNEAHTFNLSHDSTAKYTARQALGWQLKMESFDYTHPLQICLCGSSTQAGVTKHLLGSNASYFRGTGRHLARQQPGLCWKRSSLIILLESAKDHSGCLLVHKQGAILDVGACKAQQPEHALGSWMAIGTVAGERKLQAGEMAV